MHFYLKSVLFSLWMVVQDLGVMQSDSKPALSPKDRQLSLIAGLCYVSQDFRWLKSCDFNIISQLL